MTTNHEEIRRVVMLTPDWEIDRRILQEAKTLVAHGKEVIVIASAQGDQPEFERHGKVKIHRVRFAGVEQRFRWITGLRMLNATVIGKLHGGTQHLARWGATALKFLVLVVPAVSYFALATFIRFGGRVADHLSSGQPLIALRERNHARLQALHARGRSFLAQLQQLRVAWIQKAFEKCGVLSDRGFVLALLIAARWSGMSAYEWFLSRKAMFYRPDIVHAHDLPVLAAGVLAAREAGAQCVYDSHELYTEEELPPAAKRHLVKQERRCAPHVHWAITVNHFIRDELANRYPFRRVEVIENAIDRPSEFDAGHRYDLLREETGLAKDQLIVLYQGWFAPGRNLENLVRAFRGVRKNAHLVMMGFGDYRADLEALVEDLELGKAVHFIDAKPQEKLLYYTASADVGVMPYVFRGSLNNLYSSPNKLYEYIAAGLPILANELPYYEEIVGRFGNGVVTPLDTPENIAAAMETILSKDLNALRRCSRAAYATLNWESEGRKLVAIYDKLSESRATRSA